MLDVILNILMWDIKMMHYWNIWDGLFVSCNTCKTSVRQLYPRLTIFYDDQKIWLQVRFSALFHFHVHYVHHLGLHSPTFTSSWVGNGNRYNALLLQTSHIVFAQIVSPAVWRVHVRECRLGYRHTLATIQVSVFQYISYNCTPSLFI